MTDTDNRAEPMKPQYALTRSIIHDCPAITLPQSFVERLGLAARIVVLKGADQQIALEIVRLLNVAAELEASRLPLGRCRGCGSTAAREAMEKAHEELVGAIEMTAYGRHPMALTCVNLAEKILRAALAAAPLERIALSDEQIRAAWIRAVESGNFNDPIDRVYPRFARILEAEHGITLAPIAQGEAKGDGNG